jgi:hypothetical protein
MMLLWISFIVDNWQTLISLLFAIIGGSFALYQWTKSIKTKRAELLNQILEKLRFDKDLVDIIYVIDYNQEWYNISFHNSGTEKIIDKLFSYLNYICYLEKTNNLTGREFKIFQYEIHRVCISESIKWYLWNLYHFSKKNNSVCPVHFLIDYAIKNKIFIKDFKTNKTLYGKTLNW